MRSYKNREFFGEQLYQAFLEVKKAFDPLNPGKIVEAQDLAENLRIHPAYRPSFPETHFHFREEQGFDRAIEMCTGVGHCRKSLGGTMWPSYMATRDEEHSPDSAAAPRSSTSPESAPTTSPKSWPVRSPNRKKSEGVREWRCGAEI